MMGTREDTRRAFARRPAPGSDERGVALVEFALVAPLLMLLLFGMAEFGRAFNYWIDETHLANTGARMAVVDNWPGKGSQTLQAYLISEADTGELQDKMAVCIRFPDPTNPADDNPNPPAVGDPVEVTVWMKDPFDFLGLVGGWSKHIRASSTMRLEKVPTGSPPYAFTNPLDNDCP